jgi:hypothetical protein
MTTVGRPVRSRVACCVIAATALFVGSAKAQRITGRVRESSTDRPVAGAVVSLLDSTGHTISRTITDRQGQYVFSTAPPVVQLRAIRIGYRPVTVRLSSGNRDTAITVTMDRLPVQLEAVRVSSDATCDASDDTRAALDLWDQARSGLLTAIVARDAKPAHASTLIYERRYDVRGGRITHQRSTMTTGMSSRPFVARPATTLAQQGYRTMSGDQQVYFAPDADVLLDDSFLMSHCFGIRVRDHDHPGQVGMTFEPRARDVRDSIVDVRGILWLDPAGPALVALEYRYTGVHPLAAQAGAGGRVHFQSMANGVTFVDEWSITLPVVKNLGSRRLADTPYTPTLVDVGESGGFVTAARWDDSTLWVTHNLGAIIGDVVDREMHRPVVGVKVAISGATETTTDTVGRFTFGFLPRGRYALELTDTTFGAFLRSRTASRDVDVGPGDTVRLRLDVASRASLIASLCKNLPRESQVILGDISDGTGVWPKDLHVESSWQSDFMQTSDGIVARNAAQSTDVDDAGRFHVCGAARQRPARLQAVVGHVTVADTVLRPSTDTARAVRWIVRSGAFTAAQLGDGSAFTGRVLRASDGTPVVDAEVALLPIDERVRTDSAGRFQLLGLSAGRQLVEIRRIGFGAIRDTVTLKARAQATRDFSLTQQAVALDTVRTKGDFVKYISPALQAFEARRAQGMGHFVSEAELRKYDTGPITSLLSTHLPGTLLVSYGGAMFLETARSPALTMLAIPSDRKSPQGCWADVYVDGIALYRGPPDDAPDVSRLQTNQFGGIEYYSGFASIPPQFISVKQSGCGVLLLWSRER